MAEKPRLIRTLFLLALLTLVVSACSTKKNTFTRRLYHNLNSHYNAYWNGNESLKQGVLDLQKTAKDNYTTVLPVYNYGTEANAQAVNPNMDRAIEKASIVIQRHSMKFDNKEHVKWVMYSYMLIGKANYFKQDYNAARRAFEFVTKEYPYDQVKYEAMLWLGRSFQQLEQFDRAIAVYDLMGEESKVALLPWSVRKALPLAYGDLLIAQRKYNEAGEYLEKGFSLQSGSKLKTRLNYILGQIYQLKGEDSQAAEYYTLALKGTPSFEMSFNSRINLARVFDAARSDRRQIVKELEKMLKDSKNRDFQDQIYFALADISFKQKEDSVGVVHLRKSVASSMGNDFQKSVSSLRLADEYFKQKQYGFAQLYYDTTLLFLPKEFPDYEKISTRTEIVTRLVTNLQTIHVQDSLQALARMPERQRFEVIDNAIAQFIAREQEIAKKTQDEKMALEAGVALGGRVISDLDGETVVGGGGWYFYNPSAIGMGYSEFTRKWGRRRLEDNWRLSNKRVVNFDAMEGEEIASDSIPGSDKSTAGANLRNRQTYLASLPFTAEQVAISNEQISESLYDAGVIYLEELNDAPKAEESFTQLLARFPDSENALQGHYYMYRINKDAGDSSQMAFHQEQIVERYPESDYAKLLVDPGYKVELEEARNRVKTLYGETWQAFQDQLYRMVIIYSNDAITNYPGNELIPMFGYLRALALGKTSGTDVMNVELAQLVTDYPSSGIIPYVNELLGKKETVATNVAGGNPADSTTATLDISMFVNDPENSHSYSLIVDGTAVNVYATKVRIADFNSRNYAQDNLQVSSVELDGNRQMITVGNFNNAEQGMIYFNHIASDAYVFSGILEGTYDHFVISAINFPVFFQQRQVPNYIQFFKKHYANLTN